MYCAGPCGEFLCVFLCVLCAFARKSFEELRAKAQSTQKNMQRINRALWRARETPPQRGEHTPLASAHPEKC